MEAQAGGAGGAGIRRAQRKVEELQEQLGAGAGAGAASDGGGAGGAEVSRGLEQEKQGLLGRVEKG